MKLIMKILKWVLIVLTVLILAALLFLAYMGVFSGVKVSEREMGPYIIVYEKFVGPYANTGPVFEKVYKALAEEGIKATDGIGIYYDDPKTVPADKLRSDCGVVIEEMYSGKIPELQKRFNIMTIEKKMSVVAEFPIRNNLSYMIGPMKGYPALMEYSASKGYKMAQPYELYDMKNNTICFVMEISK